jgi:glycerol-3-phosphate dehydrogenase subunit B
MIRETRCINTQLAIVGTGLAGLAAGIFALERGIKCAQIGHTGAITYTTGYFDLLAGLPGEDPWQALNILRREKPEHPLSRIGNDDIDTAWHLFIKSLSNMGIGYTEPGGANVQALLPSGVCKPTFSVPLTMQAGITAMQGQARTLIVDFTGLQGFSAVEFVTNLKPSWSALSAKRMHFPGMEGGQQIFAEVMARSLEVASNRQRLADAIKPLLGDAEYLGMPAILGIHTPDVILADMERLLGIPLFEIPTMPPAVPGIRLREMFEQVFPAKGISLIPQHKVEKVVLHSDGATLYIKDSFGDVEINSQATILATGRFLSGGLSAGQQSICETLLDIPVSQPENRDSWYQQRYFDPKGHEINQAGIEIDAKFHPLDVDGSPINNRLFAAGTILAHQDWIRQRCGASISIASAYQAVRAATQVLS